MNTYIFDGGVFFVPKDELSEVHSTATAVARGLGGGCHCARVLRLAPGECEGAAD